MTAPAERIKEQARALGFDEAGIAEPAAIGKAGARLDAFLAQGRHGDMDWMARTAARRRHPRALWPEVASVVVVAMNYGPGEDPLRLLEARDRGVISVYARNRDYHDLMKARLKALARFIGHEFGAEAKIFVDTAPVMEKPLAAAAGIGWQGKHSNLVSTRLGSWLFLGVVFTTLPLPPDRAHQDRCGSCRRCLDICPTDAFPAPYQLDARRCISYLTIEHKGHIPGEFRAAIGNRIFGCDDCLAVCPWNKFARTAREAAFHARAELAAPRLADLADLDEADFRAVFSGSPVKRTGRDRFVRNVLVAIGNSGDPGLLPAVRARLEDPSPLVRAMAVWALGRLADRDEAAQHAARLLPEETDPGVRREWTALCRPIA